MVDVALISCRQRWGMQAKELRIDHNLMIDTFGNQADTTFAGLPVRAIPLEYGRDHIMVMQCESGYVGLYVDGRTERVDRPLG